jgi:predicted transcriptional regulator
MTELSDAIISIRPNFADAILSGTKTVELRRRIPPIDVGTRLWIYATRPTAAIVGSAIVGAIIRDTPDALWKKVSKYAAIERDEFDGYFDGSDVGIGITLCTVKPVTHIGIERLRKWRSGFHPPQVLSKITASEAKRLLKILSN